MTNKLTKQRAWLFRSKPRFQLIWLFVLTTIASLVIGVFTRRQDSLDAELKMIAGTWNAVPVEGFDYVGTSFDFEESRFKLLKPGVFEVKLANDDVVYGVYKKDGNLLYYTESHPWCGCPADIDDLQPAVDWDTPPLVAESLYTQKQRAHRYLLRLQEEKEDDVPKQGQ